MVYVPQEDSYLLLEQVKKYAQGKVLDMGTGSGVQAIGAASLQRVKSVLAVDVDTKAVQKCKEEVKKGKVAKVKCKQSDLFSTIKGTFDVITFNPPYLPQDKGIEAVDLYGGKHGYEVIGKFLNQVNKYLAKNGFILLLFSSQSKKDKVEEYIEKNLLEFTLLSKQHQFFEDLYVYKIEKQDILKKVEGRGVHSFTYLDKGKRGVVFTGIYRGKKVAIKIKRKTSEALARIENESAWLKRLNKHKIGPKVLFSGKNYLVYEFIKGEFILDYMEKLSVKKCLQVINKCLDKCFVLDSLKVDKLEMHHPVKHILIGRGITFIDFEKTHHAQHPKNVTQFVQFITGKIGLLLGKKGKKIDRQALRNLAQEYKNNPTKKHLNKIKKCLA